MKNIICLILAVFMTMVMIGCTPQNIGDPLDETEQQKTEDVTSSENPSNEEVTNNTTETTTENTPDSTTQPTDTAESTGAETEDEWTGIY